MSISTVKRIRFAKLAVFIFSTVLFAAGVKAFVEVRAQAASQDSNRESASQSRGPSASPDWYGGARPILHYREDAVRKRAWILAVDGVHVYDLDTHRKIGDARIKEWIWAGAPYGCAPELALGPAGEALVSTDVSPTLWRIDPLTFAVTRHDVLLDQDTDKDVEFSGLAYSPEHGAFFAISYFHGSLWRVDPSLKGAQKVALATPVPRACGRDASSRALSWREGPAWSLCVASDRGMRQINLAPDLRSGVAVARSCKSKD